MHVDNSRTIKSRFKRGSTLIELLIAATITVMVMTAVAISMMYSIQRETQNRYKETASTLAQDTLDLIQTKRADLGWDQFVTDFTGSFCVDESGAFYPMGNNCANYPMSYGGLAFDRSVDLVLQPLGGMKATVVVTWQASSDPSTFAVEQTYYKGVY